MKALTSVLTVATFSLLVVAHGGGGNLQARQASASSSSSSHSGSANPTTSGPVSSNSVNPTASTLSTGASSTPSITLLATNPTAVPLASILSNEPSLPPQPITTTESPGPGPTDISGAPRLPDISSFNVNDYPKWDVTPPIDSAEVKQWIQEVADTGIQVPGLSPNNPGGCPNNTNVKASDPNVCWWSCSGCSSGADITDCPTALDWGLTYDDGPSYYTTILLQYLDQIKKKGTFFVVGSRCLQFPEILRLQYMSGHQIAVHTWSHPSMTTLSNEAIIAELGWSKKVIKDLTGLTPNVWRPPYGDIDNRVRAISIAMGLTPVIWTRNPQTGLTFDTGDFNIKGGTTNVYQVLQNWLYIVGNATSMITGFIVLEHDLWEQTVQIATGYILPDALTRNFNIKTVVGCLNMPLANAYIETNNNDTNKPAISGSFVTTSQVAESTGGSNHSSSDPRFSVGFSYMFIMTIVTLLAGVYAVRF